MAFRFVLDDDFADQVVRDEEVLVPVLEVLGHAVRDRAAELYPDDPDTGPPDLHTDITVDIALGAHGLVGRVNANNWKAGWYEFGTSRIPAVHALTRALEEHVGPLQPGSADD